jgi:hypothetical protein
LALEISHQISWRFIGSCLRCRYHAELVCVKDESPRIFCLRLVASSEEILEAGHRAHHAEDTDADLGHDSYLFTRLLPFIGAFGALRE